VLTIQFTASPSLGWNVQMQVLVDGAPVGTQVNLAPGQSMPPITAAVAAGFHEIQFSAGSDCPGLGDYTIGTGAITTQDDPDPSVPALSPWGLCLLAVLLLGTSAWTMAKLSRQWNG
jgi:hypothetical protein